VKKLSERGTKTPARERVDRLPPDLESYFWVSRRSIPSSVTLAWKYKENTQKSIRISKFSDAFSTLITSLNCRVSTWNWRKFHEEHISANTFPLSIYPFNILGKITFGGKTIPGGRVDRLPSGLESYFGVLRTSIPSFVKFAQSASFWLFSGVTERTIISKVTWQAHKRTANFTVRASFLLHIFLYILIWLNMQQSFLLSISWLHMISMNRTFES